MTIVINALPPKAPWYKRLVRGTLMGIGGAVVACGVVAAVFGAGVFYAPVHLPSDMVLTVKLQGDVPEYDRFGEWESLLGQGRMTLPNMVDAMDLAARDKRVKGLFVTIGDGDYSVTQVDMLRAAFQRLHAAGKAVTVYADALSEAGSGMEAYHLASAADKIYLLDGGTLTLTGYRAEVPYFKTLMDKFGVKSEISQRENYKTAPESALRTSMSTEQRQTLTNLLTQYDTVFAGDVAAGRHIALDTLKRDLARMPMTTDEALKAGLIDDVMDEKDARDAALDGRDAVTLDEYAASAFEHLPDPLDTKPTIAYIQMDGMIVGGDEESPDLISADTFADAINAVAQDDSVSTLVVRVNSPGGAPQASEKIRQALTRVQDADKKVIVSMGDVAASGGYWMSASADTIYAQRLTLTGSIGVFGGKMDISGAAQKFGVTFDSVQTNPMAAMWSFVTPYTSAGHAANEKMLDDVYARFKNVVADGRGIPAETVAKLAGGRVYTGVQAVGVKLVDRIGSVVDVLNDAAQELGYADRFDANVVDYTPQPEAFFALRDLFGVQIQAVMHRVLVETLSAAHISVPRIR